MRPTTRRPGLIQSRSGEFLFKFFETDELGANFAHLFGKMIRNSDQVTMGELWGDLMNRGPRCRFFSMCDDCSQELIDTARFCANANGTLRQPLCAKIQDKARTKAAFMGGLLFLDEVHVLRSCRGRDLSLELVSALLCHLGCQWMLVVGTIMLWDYADQDTATRPAQKGTDKERTPPLRAPWHAAGE